jgi:hypothetical protein
MYANRPYVMEKDAPASGGQGQAWTPDDALASPAYAGAGLQASDGSGAQGRAAFVRGGGARPAAEPGTRRRLDLGGAAARRRRHTGRVQFSLWRGGEGGQNPWLSASRDVHPGERDRHAAAGWTSTTAVHGRSWSWSCPARPRSAASKGEVPAEPRKWWLRLERPSGQSSLETLWAAAA